MTTKRSTTRTRSLLGALAVAAVLTGGCSAASEDSGEVSSSQPEPASDAGQDPAAEQDAAGRTDGGAAPAKGPGQVEPSPAMIKTATVSLDSDDVRDARTEVQKIADQAGGAITEEETTTDDDGELDTARLVLRVPSAKFDATKDAVEEVAELDESTTGSDDVSTEVVDVEARIRAQEKSVRRIEALLARAASLSEIIAIEGDLAQRQADLDALKSRYAWLKDQTGLATITVYVERTEAEEKDDQDEDTADGFLGGLSAGWDSFVTGLVVAGTVVGFLLPWLVAVGVVVVPLVLWLRSRRGRRPAPLPQP